MIDMSGVSIEVGDTVVYLGRYGSSLWLTAATVIYVGDTTLTVTATHRSGHLAAPRRHSQVLATDRVAVVKKHNKESE